MTTETIKDPRAILAMQRWDELRTERTMFLDDWEDIARLIRPQRGGFGLQDITGRSYEKPLSSAPIVAQSNLASGLYGTLTNPANKWFGMKTPDSDLNDFKPMREWLDTAAKITLASFRPAVSPFYDASIQLFSDITAFGNSAQYDEIVPAEQKIMDVTLSLAEVVWDIDAWGRVVEVVRRFKLKPAAAVRLFRKEQEMLPPKLIEMAEKNSNDQIAFYHHVHLNEDYSSGMLSTKGKRYVSVHACEMGGTVIRERGYDEMPFHVPRWEVESGFQCGTGPGFVALASARIHHRMDEASIRAAQYAADPVRLAPDRDDWPMQGRARPGTIIYGGVNMQGNPMVRTMESHAGIGLTLDEKQGKVDEIKDAFNWSLMNLAGRTGMTATEVMTIQEERQRLMAPHQGRIQHEYLAPKIERRFSMLWRAGQLPPPPPEASGAPLEVDYISAAAMAQRSTEGAAITRLLADLAPMAELNPRYLDRIDPDATLEALHAARGVPESVLLSREDADQMAKQRAEASQAQEQMAMLEQAGGIANDVAGAAAQAGMVPDGAQMQ